MNPTRLGEQFAQDVRYAFRTMAARPLFTVMAVLSLALGIGANTAIYSFMDSILMRAIPVRDPASLVVLNWRAPKEGKVIHSFSGSSFGDPQHGVTSGNFPYAAYELFAAGTPVFSHTFAFSGAGRLNLQIRGQAGLASGQYVSGTFFTGLGTPPAAGRLVDSTDDRAGAPTTAVISYGYAQRRFGDIAKAVGESVLINDIPFVIIGVAAPEF